MPRSGRPNRRLSQRLVVCLPPEIYVAVVALAARDDRDVSAYARHVLASHVRSCGDQQLGLKRAG